MRKPQGALSNKLSLTHRKTILERNLYDLIHNVPAAPAIEHFLCDDFEQSF